MLPRACRRDTSFSAPRRLEVLTAHISASTSSSAGQLGRKCRRPLPACVLGLGPATQKDTLPIFVLHPALPGAEEALHIFEPRYRLMLQRCLERQGPMGESGEFGMCWPVANEEFSPVGTLVRVTDYQSLPDGRLNVRCTGIRRFRVLSRGSESGFEPSTKTDAVYQTAEVEWFDDNEDQESEPVAQKDQFSNVAADEVLDNASGVAATQLELANLHAVLLQAYPKPVAKLLLLRIHGPEAYTTIAKDLDVPKKGLGNRSVSIQVPAPDVPADLAWWILGTVVPLPPEAKANLVTSRSVTWRLACATELLERMTSEIQGEVTGMVDGPEPMTD